MACVFTKLSRNHINLYLGNRESVAGTGKCVVFTWSLPLPTGDARI